MKSSSESILPAVVAGVAIRLFLVCCASSWVTVSESESREVTRGRLEGDLDSGVVSVAGPVRVVEALVAALGGDWSVSAIAASAAFLFRVRRGVVKKRGDHCADNLSKEGQVMAECKVRLEEGGGRRGE